MTITSEVYVGIDVAKDKLDVAMWGEKGCPELSNSKRGIAKLVKQMLVLGPKLIVVEATGGSEEAVTSSLSVWQPPAEPLNPYPKKQQLP